eukprot:CAMPEP_0173100286 /NCGR_PEP_ID=MMETSP1102-20130122/36110_1 /TAXON_ID=49646 /ORGANISM="Geminigera sp., Strain Caron Lab Isolate" /LENGTH=72 /DNA_ID=CAMNT_0013993693 /DNA_START=28 /DNA_END=243 /DNA_ORIENTATION=-
MLQRVLPLALIAYASAFAPGAVLPTSTRNVAAVGPTMQRLGSVKPSGGQGSTAGKTGLDGWEAGLDGWEAGL